MKSFTFLILSFNHEKYIIEHLESIKYLIDNYGKNILVDIILADDLSNDRTVDLASLWLNEHSSLFRNIVIPKKIKNLGTCKNLTNALQFVNSDYCKITASDDVYSFENLFQEFEKIKGCDMISGLPLNLVEGIVHNTRFDLFNIVATNVIYSNSDYNKRLKRINFFNAPSIVYSIDCLKNKNIVDFVNVFNVTEDYPLQIKMSEIYKPFKFKQVNKIFIYYRRTLNSTYIIKNTIFDKDKIAIFDYLIKEEKNFLNKFLLKNRKFVYCSVNNKYCKKLLNFNFYIYGYQIFLNYFKINRILNTINKKVNKHQEHYNYLYIKSEGLKTQYQDSLK